MTPEFSDAELLRARRSIEYARGTAVLEEDLDVPGAAGIYEQALSNGLAVIVAARWPGSECNAKGQVKSPKDILEVIAAEEARVGNTGPVLVLDGPTCAPPVCGVSIPFWDDAPEPEPGLRVEIAALRDALLATAPRRHGKPSTRALERKHVDALVRLDSDPSLGVLHGEYGDRQIAKAKVRDLWRRSNAEDYLEMLSEDEIERRVEAASGLLPWDPKDRAISLGLHECTACGYETLLAEHLDDWGIGIATGTCFVCGYYRSEAVVDEEAERFMWLNKWQHE